MSKTVRAAAFQKLPDNEPWNIVRAFLDGEPAAALQRLVELRSRSTSDMSSSAANSVDIDIEDKQLNFSWVYRKFCSSVRSAEFSSLDVCCHLLRSNVIEFILLELKSSTFSKYARESLSTSQTAKVISIQLDIIFYIFWTGALQSELRQKFKTVDYFPVFKFYMTKWSVPTRFSPHSLILQ